MREATKHIREIDENYEVVYYQSFDHPTDGLASIDPDVMRRCQIFWRQFDEGAQFNFDGETPENMREVVFASVDLGILWPYQTHDPVFTSEENFPYGMFPYGDRLLIQASQAGEGEEAGYQRWQDLRANHEFSFDRYLDMEMQRLVKREQNTEVRFAAYLLSRFRTERLLWTYNHPTGRMFAVILNRIVAATFPESRKPDHSLYKIGDRIFEHWDPLADSFQVPIYPETADALELQWWSPDDSYYFHHGERLSTEQFAKKYISERVLR